MSLIQSLLGQAFGVSKLSNFSGKPEVKLVKFSWRIIFYKIYLAIAAVRMVLLNISAARIGHNSQVGDTLLSHNHLNVWTMGLIPPKYIIFIYSTLISMIILIEVNKVLSKKQVYYLTCLINPLMDLEGEMEGGPICSREYFRSELIQSVKKNYCKLNHLYSYLPLAYASSVCSIELAALFINYKNSVAFWPSCFTFGTFIAIDAYFICKTILTYVLLLLLLACSFIAQIDHLNIKIEEKCKFANNWAVKCHLETDLSDQQMILAKMATCKKGLRDNLDELIQILTDIRICSKLFTNQLTIIIDGLAFAVGMVIFVTISIPMSVTFWIHGIASVAFASQSIIFIRLIARVPSEIVAIVKKLQHLVHFDFSASKNNWCPQERFKFNYQLTACVHKNSFTVTGSDITNDYIRKLIMLTLLNIIRIIANQRKLAANV